MATENESPEGLAKKWFLLTVVGAAIYFSVVFAFVIRGNDQLGQQTQDPQTTQVEHHD